MDGRGDILGSAKRSRGIDSEFARSLASFVGTSLRRRAQTSRHGGSGGDLRFSPFARENHGLLFHIIPAANTLGADKPVRGRTRTIRRRRRAFQVLGARFQRVKTRHVVFITHDDLIGTSATGSFQHLTAIGIHRTRLKMLELFLHGRVHFGACFILQTKYIMVTTERHDRCDKRKQKRPGVVRSIGRLRRCPAFGLEKKTCLHRPEDTPILARMLT